MEGMMVTMDSDPREAESLDSRVDMNGKGVGLRELDAADASGDAMASSYSTSRPSPNAVVPPRNASLFSGKASTSTVGPQHDEDQPGENSPAPRPRYADDLVDLSANASSSSRASTRRRSILMRSGAEPSSSTPPQRPSSRLEVASSRNSPRLPSGGAMQDSFEDAQDASVDVEDSILTSRHQGTGGRLHAAKPSHSKLRSEMRDEVAQQEDYAEDDLYHSGRASARRMRADVQESSGSSRSFAGGAVDGKRIARRRDIAKSSAHSSSVASSSVGPYDGSMMLPEDDKQLDFPARKSPLRSLMPIDFRQPPLPLPQSNGGSLRAESRSRSRTSSHMSPVLSSSPLLPRKNSGGDISSAQARLASVSNARAKELSSDPSTADRIPDFDYEGRAGTRGSRLSVDSSSVQRHLARAGTVERQERLPRADGETFADLRARKTSGSSSISQRSGGSEQSVTSGRITSLRKASRLNGSLMRHDVFANGEEVPPVPPNFRSPKTSLSSSNSDRIDDLRARRDLLRNGAGHQTSARPSEMCGSITSRPASRGPSMTGVSESSYRSGQHPRLARYAPASDAASSNGRSASMTMAGIDARHPQRSFTSLGMNDQHPRTPDLHNTWRLPSSSRKSTMDSPSLAGSSSRRSSAAFTARMTEAGSAGEMPLHAKNLSEVVEQFVHHYTTATFANTLIDGGDTETQDMVQHMEEFSFHAVGLNSGLRELLQQTLQAQIDAELNGSTDLQAWAHIDKALSSLLRSSDDQVRTLTSGLYSLMRADKERERLRKQLGSDAGSIGRPASRLSNVHTSPSKHRLNDYRETIVTTRASPRSSNGPARAESRLAGRHSVSRMGRHADHMEGQYFSGQVDSAISPMEEFGATCRLRGLGGSIHARSASEITHKVHTHSPRHQDATTAHNLRAPPSLSPKRATLSMAAVSRGELSHLFDPNSEPVPLTASSADGEAEQVEHSSSSSRRNTINGLGSIGRSSRTPSTVGYSPRNSLQLSHTLSNSTQSPVEDNNSSNPLKFVSQSLSRVAGRRTSRLFAHHHRAGSTQQDSETQ